MKKATKRLLAAFLALAMVFTLLAVPATSMRNVSASEKVGINPYSDRTVSMTPEEQKWAASGITLSGVISITGTTKASQIKKLKSSNKNMKVSAHAAASGYIAVEYKKPGKTTISCTAKGKKLKTTFTVKKYSNPVKTLKIGSKSYTSKFNKVRIASSAKKISKQTLNIKAKKGWTIDWVSVYNGSSKYYTVNKKSFSKKVTLNKKGGYVMVKLTQKSTGLSENLQIYYRK